MRVEYGLVDGHHDKSTDDYSVLVWEDEKGIGRYRVHCYGNGLWKIPNDGKKWDYFTFLYGTARLNLDIVKKDPMKEPLQRIQSLSHNLFETDHLFTETSLEQLEENLKT